MDVVVNLAGHSIKGTVDSDGDIRLCTSYITDEIENFLWTWHDMVEKEIPIRYKKDVPIKYPVLHGTLIGAWPMSTVSTMYGVTWCLMYDKSKLDYRPQLAALTEDEAKFLGLDRDVEE